jgi:hypothetical protein
MSVWNGKRFVDHMPLTAAAEAAAAARARNKTVDAKGCGCDSNPKTSARTTDAGLQLNEGLGFWKVTRR